MVLTEIFGCCVKAERHYLFAANTFAFGHLALFSDIKTIDWAVVAHHSCPDFTFSPFTVRDTEFF